LARLDRLVAQGLTATATAWPALEQSFAWVHKAAQILNNASNQPVEHVRWAFRQLLAEMWANQDRVGDLASAIRYFRKVTRSHWLGIFQCYQVADLPRTNNDLEQFFGTVRYHERRASGRKVAAPGLVVRGAVRVLAVLASRYEPLTAADLQPVDLQVWRALRAALERRQGARRLQLRFRRDPATFLADLENQLLKPSLPS
jgi:hypothetical protein